MLKENYDVVDYLDTPIQLRRYRDIALAGRDRFLTCHFGFDNPSSFEKCKR